jgi:hypothetical protein
LSVGAQLFSFRSIEQLVALIKNQSIQQGQIERLFSLLKDSSNNSAPGSGGTRPRGRGSFKEDKDAATLAMKLAAENAAESASAAGSTAATVAVPTSTATAAPVSYAHAASTLPAASPMMRWVPKVQATARPERQVSTPQKPLEPTTVKDSKAFRFMNWNIEWLDHMFAGPDDKPQIAATNAEDQINDVPALCKQIAALIKEVDADVLAIEEGPSSLAKMQLFVKVFLDDTFHCFGGIDGAQQRVYILVKKTGKVQNARVHAASMEFLSKEWYFDVDGLFKLEPYKFTRTPLVVEAEIAVEGDPTKKSPIFFMALHTKSKFIAKGKELWTSKNPNLQMDFIRKAVKNRRRIAAECARTRACIDKIIFSKHPNALILVAGDFNDGPGMDFFEEFYLLGDSIALLMGSPFAMKKLLRACLLEHSHLEENDQLYTVVFNDFVDKVAEKKVLLDHIFISNNLDHCVSRVGIAHDLFRKYSANPNGKRHERCSDHIPVFGDFVVAADKIVDQSV